MRKYKAKLELEESVSRTLTSEDCSFCGQHFWSPMNRDAHQTLYPSHFNGAVQKTGKVEAATVENLEGKVTHAKKENTNK